MSFSLGRAVLPCGSTPSACAPGTPDRPGHAEERDSYLWPTADLARWRAFSSFSRSRVRAFLRYRVLAFARSRGRAFWRFRVCFVLRYSQAPRDVERIMGAA